METGLLLTRGTALAAFVFYVISFVPRFPHPWSRIWWSAGAAIFLAYVTCAFHFMHHWCHSDAYAATAKQTYELTGLDWGGGVYFNYVFTALWLADAVWWWGSPLSHQKRPRAISYALHGFMLFMWLNGTVVFGGPFTRWMGVAGFVAMAACLITGKRDKEAYL